MKKRQRRKRRDVVAGCSGVGTGNQSLFVIMHRERADDLPEVTDNYGMKNQNMEIIRGNTFQAERYLSAKK